MHALPEDERSSGREPKHPLRGLSRDLHSCTPSTRAKADRSKASSTQARMVEPLLVAIGAPYPAKNLQELCPCVDLCAQPRGGSGHQHGTMREVRIDELLLGGEVQGSRLEGTAFQAARTREAG
jgi:hypothetical protein